MGKWQRYGLRFHRESWKDAGKGRVTDKKRSPFGRVCPPEKEGLVVQQQQPLFANGILFCFFACFFYYCTHFWVAQIGVLARCKAFLCASGKQRREFENISGHSGHSWWLVWLADCVVPLWPFCVFGVHQRPPPSLPLYNPVGIWSLPQQPFAPFVACSRTPTARARV